MTSSSTGPAFVNAAVHDALRMRSAGPDLLSLALMDARTRTLGWLQVFDGLAIQGALARLDPPAWLIGHAAWHQEYWIARHVQRGRGPLAAPDGTRLASVEPRADAWFDPQACSREQRWRQLSALPDAATLRGYLQDTLDTTLELLDKAVPDDDGLHVFRAALHHEDLVGEALATLAEALDLPAERHAAAARLGLVQPWPSRPRREPIGLPGQRVLLGTPPGGWVPPAERWQHELAVAEFEIDAQPVGWALFAEFVDDGGYDDRRWWSEAGWDWLEAVVRRAPRSVEQVSGGVLARRQGRLQRLPGGQPAMHVAYHEAEAWCRWAGRRLPTEAEWALAARQAAGRGWVWGEVLEWVGGRARAFPGGPAPEAGAERVMRGATLQASARLRHPGARRLVPALADECFVGFRSCAA